MYSTGITHDDHHMRIVKCSQYRYEFFDNFLRQQWNSTFTKSSFNIEGATEKVKNLHYFCNISLDKVLKPVIFTITKCFCYFIIIKKVDTIALSFNFFSRILILFTFSEVPSLGILLQPSKLHCSTVFDSTGSNFHIRLGWK